MEIQQANALTTRQGVTADLYRRFVAYLDTNPSTIVTYTNSLKRFFNYLALEDITEPRREDVLAYRNWLRDNGLKPTTIQNYITAVRLFFAWTAQESLYPNVAERVKGAKIDRDHKKDYLTASQIKAVLSEIKRDKLQGLRDYAIVTLIVTCGLRTIEVVRADVGDLRPVGGFTALYVQGKGREEKTEYVKISMFVEAAIRAYLKVRGKVSATDPLFVSLSNNSEGKRLSTRTVSGIAKSNMRSAGYDSARLTAHSLRHTAITLSLLGGEDITEVQKFARHANMSTTMIYNHAVDRARNTCSDTISAAIF